MRRSKLIFAAASAAVITLLVWALLPYLFPRKPRTIDITWEYRNRLPLLPMDTDMANVRALVPSSISLPDEDTWSVQFDLGLLHVEIGEGSYDAVSLRLFASLLQGPKVPSELSATFHVYLLGFFTNNSELGEVLHSHGFPHTYVEATYKIISEGPVNRTLITMTYPNGSLLIDISYTTSGKAEPWNPVYRRYVNYYYLRNGNLTILHLRQEAAPFYIFKALPEGIGRLNMTTREGSVIWRALGREYAMNLSIYVTYPLYRFGGKIGWIEWK